MKLKKKENRCVEYGCTSKVGGKDSFRCDKHEYAYYSRTFLYGDLLHSLCKEGAKNNVQVY